MIKQIGKIGKRNLQANKILKQIFEEKEIYNCELHFDGCTNYFFTGFAHRHKRVYYRNITRQKLLYDFNHVILACNNCHNKIEYNKELTKKVFLKLRGNEKK